MRGMQAMQNPALHMQCIWGSAALGGYACICTPLRGRCIPAYPPKATQTPMADSYPRRGKHDTEDGARACRPRHAGYGGMEHDWRGPSRVGVLDVPRPPGTAATLRSADETVSPMSKADPNVSGRDDVSDASFVTAYRPRYLSVSAVQLYARCPAQYRQRYVDRLVSPTNRYMAFGTAFHAALEAEHRGDDSERVLVTAWNTQQAILNAAQAGAMPSKTHALTLLETYREMGLGGAVGVPERKFVIPFPNMSIGVPLLGYIDLLLPEQRRFREFKTTSTSTWTPEKIQAQAQLHVYGRAYQSINRHRAECAEYVIFGTVNPTVEVIEAVPSPDGFRAFEMEAEAVWRGIVAGKFDGCGVCPQLCNPPNTLPLTGPTVDWEN